MPVQRGQRTALTPAQTENSTAVSLQQITLLILTKNREEIINKWYRTSGPTTPTTRAYGYIYTYKQRTLRERHGIHNKQQHDKNERYSRYDPKLKIYYREWCPLLLPFLDPIVAARVAHHPEDQLGRILPSEGFRLASAHRRPADDVKTRIVARARLALVLAHVRDGGSCRGGFSGGDRCIVLPRG